MAVNQMKEEVAGLDDACSALLSAEIAEKR
jgi:hypothetical protein